MLKTLSLIEVQKVRSSGEFRLEGVRLGVDGYLRGLRWALLGFVFLLPLAVLPGLEQPFSRPKLILLAIVVPVGLLSCWRQLKTVWGSFPLVLKITLAVWLGALGASAVWGQFASPETFLLPLLGVGWLLLMIAVGQRPETLAGALVASASAVAFLALLQFVHADPFSATGWMSLSDGSARMRVFVTLGNPNFVAAFLSGVLPLTFGLASQVRRRRLLLIGMFALQAVAILATGSRAPILALAAALLWMASMQPRKLAHAFGLVALCIAFFAAASSPARNLENTLSGRLYIWKVSAPHLADHFLLGFGPGGFGAAFPAWETQYWQATVDDRDRAFAGVEDHAHNDYLEFAVENGIAGLTGFLALVGVFLVFVCRRATSSRGSLVTGATAGVVALLAIALVDFPLHRPTETFAFWTLLGIAYLSTTDAGANRSSNGLGQPSLLKGNVR